MTSIETYANYALRFNEYDELVDASGQSFPAEAYSRMKYGDREATRQFGWDLAKGLIENVPEMTGGEIAPQLLVAYKAVPPACFYLSRFCLDRLNIERVTQGLEPGRIMQVYKNSVTATNYAGASPEDRERELSTIDFSLEGREVAKQPIAVLDDIRITGAAERRILEVIARGEPSLIALGYIATFDAAQAASRPTVEHDINTTVIKDPSDLLDSIEADNFDLNIRTLKLILATAPENLATFLEAIPERLLEEIVRGATDTGPDFISKYAPGFTTVKNISRARLGT